MNSTLEVFMSYKTAEINTFCYTTLCTRSLLKHPICAKWRIFSKHTIRSTLKLIRLDFLIKQISCIKNIQISTFLQKLSYHIRNRYYAGQKILAVIVCQFKKKKKL
jgi:hypothetical protein